MHIQAQNAVFKRLESIVDLASLSREERRRYDSAIKAYRDYHNQMEFARQQGMELGEKRGLEQGARNTQIKAIRNMRAKGYVDELIADLLELPLDAVKRLS